MKKKYIIPFTEVITTKTESLLHAGTIANQKGDESETQHGIGENNNANIEVDSKLNYWDKHFDAWSH